MLTMMHPRNDTVKPPAQKMGACEGHDTHAYNNIAYQKAQAQQQEESFNWPAGP